MVDVVVISKLLGHSSIAVTSRYLDHLTYHQAVTALEGVDLPRIGQFGPTAAFAGRGGGAIP